MDDAAPTLQPARLAGAVAVYTATHLTLTAILLALGSWDGASAYAVFAVSAVTAVLTTRIVLGSDLLSRLLHLD